MSSSTYKDAWERPDDLDTLNRRIHDGVALLDLQERAANRRDTFFELCFPYAKPQAGAKVLELGQGVGWIMQSMLDAYPIDEIVGLDISENMIARAKERWDDPRARYVAYDGLTVPIESDYFDNIYSVACIQHIEKHHAFLIMKELLRILRPGGHATIHLLSVHRLANPDRPYEQECVNHVTNAPKHWHHYYSYDEIVVLLSEALGVSDLDIKYYRRNFWVHFSKGGSEPFHDPVVQEEFFLNRRVDPSIRLQSR
jgi:ubiquinone/menaquinone biosynthesis C-methylase UbiE